MEGMGTEESTLIEILCPKSNEEVHTLVAKYEESKYFHIVRFIKMTHFSFHFSV